MPESVAGRAHLTSRVPVENTGEVQSMTSPAAQSLPDDRKSVARPRTPVRPLRLQEFARTIL